MDTPRFHAGELAIQERVGVHMEGAATGIRDYMPDQHRRFFGELPFFFIGALDAAGQPWASMLAADPGFITTPDERTLRIDGGMLPGDPLQGQLLPGRYLGGLGLAPLTRRRNRVNGLIEAADGGALRVAVMQSFGNCPQYIQQREQRAAPPRPQALVLRSRALSLEDRALIEGADTFFIASANLDEAAGQARGVDVSHRGGRPGFVRIDDERTLVAPEFVGNFFFNTLGNLARNPRAGLLFIDFDKGDLLHLAVEGEIVWDDPQLPAFAGAERLLRFHVREVVRNVGALPFRWSAARPATQLARTGNWREAAGVIEGSKLSTAWRPFKTTAVTRESAGVLSFRFEPADGIGLAPHLPGQFIMLRTPEGAVRSYTLSDASDGHSYRISVKRDGAVSGWLHDHLAPGVRIDLMGPGGDFIFEEGTQRPAVLLSAGIGITPTIAMLNSLLVNGNRTRHRHPIYVIHGARTPGELAFGEHLRTLAAGHSNLQVVLRFSGMPKGSVFDGDSANWHADTGRVDMALLKQVLPAGDYDFYLCGPGAFMQAMHEGLRAQGVDEARIRFEAFGPGSL
jgi:ferredoxin-NADP reductase/predicted pyridoxine 5'-phosphate oxidase superfamily flavin-nucleotide-binding protein